MRDKNDNLFFLITMVSISSRDNVLSHRDWAEENEEEGNEGKEEGAINDLSFSYSDSWP